MYTYPFIKFTSNYANYSYSTICSILYLTVIIIYFIGFNCIKLYIHNYYVYYTINHILSHFLRIYGRNGGNLTRVLLLSDRETVNRKLQWMNKHGIASIIRKEWQIFNITESFYIAQNFLREKVASVLITSCWTIITENRIFKFFIRNDKMHKKRG